MVVVPPVIQRGSRLPLGTDRNDMHRKSMHRYSRGLLRSPKSPVQPPALPPSGKYCILVSIPFSYRPGPACLAVRDITDVPLGCNITSFDHVSPWMKPQGGPRTRHALPDTVTSGFGDLRDSYQLPRPYWARGLKCHFSNQQTWCFVVDAEVAWIPMNMDKEGAFERPNRDEMARV
ncbi:hypothetical protein JVT61DRAFT_11710 [Boletus reticuloceps]|uniref:Uncharacterized protein n=1 Tax=Boletus reticuloceps TaxID=495285 RepID=A0A8I2YW64_9AGAM|nr:hypothetical protein JVT61DRAFT_11710 [Boletus reticuloceps]